MIKLGMIHADIQPGLIVNAEMDSANAVDVGWDINAASRAQELYSNDDPAYRSLMHIVLNEINSIQLPSDAHILDIGCGLGVLANEICAAGYDVVGIDPSGVSIDMARMQYSNPREVFSVATLQDFASDGGAKFDVAVANMTLHCVKDLAGFFQSCATVLSPAGKLIITIPNPRTYLQTREDVDVSELDLGQSQTIPIRFRIRGHNAHPASVLFYHRPIRIYAQQIDAVRMRIEDIYYPAQVGPGRSQDIAVLIVTWSNFKNR